MANAIEKFTLSAARNIPFNKLVPSQQTVRKIRAALSIEDLAQDIAIADCSPASTSGPHSTAMATRPASTAFPPGGALSRFRTLVAQKRLTRTASIPCIVSRGDTQEVEDPLAEGLQRIALHPLDQFAGLAGLEQGLGEQEFADHDCIGGNESGQSRNFPTGKPTSKTSRKRQAMTPAIRDVSLKANLTAAQSVHQHHKSLTRSRCGRVF
ncbi:hypothetical protein ABIE40_005867 [Rhizobium sp. OAE497]